MQIILTEDVPHLGNMGDLVTVKPGYGRNYLVPRGLAVIATAGNQKAQQHMLRQIEEKRARLKASAEELGNKLQEISLTITRQSGTDGRLFGSVNNRDIETALAAEGVTVERRRIMLREPIKALGEYEIPVKLHADVTATLRLQIAAL